MAIAHINRIGTAHPANEVHRQFVDWARARIDDPRTATVFGRMADRSGIERRWSVLARPGEGAGTDLIGFYGGAVLPGTEARMALYAAEAPPLALEAIAALGPLGRISHLVVASCTGFVAPGIDQILAKALGLDGGIERTLVGFMGCYAAVAALRVAHHLVRSTPEARVLVVMVELSTLHLQPSHDIGALLAMLQFGDGAGAAIVSAEPEGLAIERIFAATLPDSDTLMRWTIGDQGFVMELSGAVPNRIADALGDATTRELITGGRTADAWAVHAGGRSVLDAVERALALPAEALADSRGVLAGCGNMSSATLMFVLQRMLARGAAIEHGVAVAFGPGLAAEGFGFRTAR